jgi:hypothetical protein
VLQIKERKTGLKWKLLDVLHSGPSPWGAVLRLGLKWDGQREVIWAEKGGGETDPLKLRFLA